MFMREGTREACGWRGCEGREVGVGGGGGEEVRRVRGVGRG